MKYKLFVAKIKELIISQWGSPPSPPPPSFSTIIDNKRMNT
jgi:hypothetical protein